MKRIGYIFKITSNSTNERSRKGVSGGVTRISAVALIVALAVSCLLLSGCQPQIEPEPVPEPMIPVQVSPVATSAMEDVMTYSGQVTPSDEAAVMSTSAGKVTAVNFDIGDSVRKGDVLFSLDRRTIEDNIKTLRAQLAAAQTSVRTAETAVKNVTGGQWQSQMLTSSSAIDKAKLALDDAQRNYDNAKLMFELGESSEVQLHQTEVAVQSAQLAYDQAKSSYDIASEKISSDNLETAQNALEQAKAQVNTLNVQISNATSMLSDTTVKSPIDGIVSVCNAKAGSMISMSSPAFTIVNIDTVKFVVKVTENTINKLAEDMPIEVSIPAASQEKFDGVIDVVPPVADQSKTFPVRVKISNADHMIKAGMFGQVNIVLASHKDVVAIPLNTVLEDESGSYVFIAEGDSAKKVPVTTGLNDGQRVEITSGLTAGQSLVVVGQTYLTDGEKIKIVPGKEETR